MTKMKTSAATDLNAVVLQQGARSSRAHQRFLEARQEALYQMGDLIAMQIDQLAATTGIAFTSHADQRKALFGPKQLEAFASGSVVQCFGADFSIYENRRTPRIPNGELLLISRVIAINGERGNLKQGDIQAEYDVPATAWYLHDGSFAAAPQSILMEIALQPCGFLSAYLGSQLLFPEIDFYFRNLNGTIELLAYPDLAGKTIRNHARLLSTVVSGENIIQKFAFELSLDGNVFYRGESTFGFFTRRALMGQGGLDGGKTVAPWRQTLKDATLHLRSALPSLQHAPTGKMRILDHYAVMRDGGKYGKGYVFAKHRIDPTEWYYRCHFYQDAVMPGSLGVEAILQSMQVYATASGLLEGLRAPRFALPCNQPLSWRYRGQVLPAPGEMSIEAHITDVLRLPHETVLLAEASLWCNHTRIYEIKSAAISITEG